VTKKSSSFSSRRASVLIRAVILFAVPSQFGAGIVCAQSGAFIVLTTFRQIRGVQRSKAGAEFRGIPCAQPPLGNLRWHESLLSKPWRSMRNATKLGAPCMQPSWGTNRHV
jgi:para-nitrobenzyl esterase